ncbi:MAG: acetolactate decarboxylase [Microcella sp.]|uniref:acetolactate decarboxylase n=1 Tax=Microcella sp. TaxID=1913979 RepID=UPI003315630B
MLDDVLHRLRSSRLGRIDRGRVTQVRSAQSLFSGNYSGAATVGHEFSGTRLGLGVMHDLEGELVSLRGETWRVPVCGTPEVVAVDETIAFGIAASGGIPHSFTVDAGVGIEGIGDALDGYLSATFVDHEEVVCAIELTGTFTDVVLRTVGHPDHVGEPLAEVIENETRFAFDVWHGTLVGFRYPDATSGSTIPGLHLHAISDDRRSGGHVRNATTARVTASLWIDDVHIERDDAGAAEGREAIDFISLEGPLQADPVP